MNFIKSHRCWIWIPSSIWIISRKITCFGKQLPCTTYPPNRPGSSSVYIFLPSSLAFCPTWNKLHRRSSELSFLFLVKFNCQMKNVCVCVIVAFVCCQTCWRSLYCLGTSFCVNTHRQDNTSPGRNKESHECWPLKEIRILIFNIFKFETKSNEYWFGRLRVFSSLFFLFLIT